jgi:hypothetical protein
LHAPCSCNLQVGDYALRAHGVDSANAWLPGGWPIA